MHDSGVSRARRFWPEQDGGQHCDTGRIDLGFTQEQDYVHDVRSTQGLYSSTPASTQASVCTGVMMYKSSTIAGKQATVTACPFLPVQTTHVCYVHCKAGTYTLP